MNVERLRMVKEKILRNPNRTNMRSVHSEDGCHCIFGWGQVLFSPRFFDRFWKGRFAKTPDNQGELFGYLGMNYMEGRRLFHFQLWPADLNIHYQNATTAQRRAEVAAEAIDRFIEDPGFRKDDATKFMNSRSFIVQTII